MNETVLKNEKDIGLIEYSLPLKFLIFSQTRDMLHISYGNIKRKCGTEICKKWSGYSSFFELIQYSLIQ